MLYLPKALSVKQLARQADRSIPLPLPQQIHRTTYQHGSLYLTGSRHLGQLGQGPLRVEHFVHLREEELVIPFKHCPSLLVNEALHYPY